MLYSLHNILEEIRYLFSEATHLACMLEKDRLILLLSFHSAKEEHQKLRPFRVVITEEDFKLWHGRDEELLNLIRNDFKEYLFSQKPFERVYDEKGKIIEKKE